MLNSSNKSSSYNFAGTAAATPTTSIRPDSAGLGSLNHSLILSLNLILSINHRPLAMATATANTKTCLPRFASFISSATFSATTPTQI